MSTFTLPGLRRDHRPRPKHRATDEVDRLRIELARKAQALEAADGLIGRLKVSNDQLLTKATRYDEAEAYAKAVEQELNELRAFKANATAISAPVGQRDVDPDDQPTHPVDVRPLWEALGISPVRAVADTGQTGWGARNEQQGVAS